MGSLIKNERTKLYKRKSTLVILLIVLGLYLMQFVFTAVLPMIIDVGYGNMSWEDAYRNQIGDYENWAAESDNSKMDIAGYEPELSWLKWLLEHEVPPTDWRADAALAMFEEAYVPPQGDESSINTARVTALQGFLEGNDWKGYVQYRIQEEWFDSNAQTDAERAVEHEILALYLDLNISPTSTRTMERLYYIGITALEADTNSWRADQLDILRGNKIALLRGEKEDMFGNTTILTKSQRQQFELENKVVLQRLKTNTTPMVADSFWGWVDSTVVSSNYVLIALLVLAGVIVAGEFSGGTIKLLLITPHKRQKIFWAKAYALLEAMLLLAGAILVAGLAVAALATMMEGVGDWQVTVFFGNVVRMPMAVYVLLKYLLGLLPVIAMSAMGLMFSTVLRRNGLAIALPLVVYFIGQMATVLITTLLVELTGNAPPIMGYIVFSHLTVQEHMPGAMSALAGGGMNGMLTGGTGTSLLFAVSVLVAYTALFLWIARDSFVRKDVK